VSEADLVFLLALLTTVATGLCALPFILPLFTRYPRVSAPVPAGRRVNRPLPPPVRSVGVLLAGYVPEDGLILRGAAQRQLEMLPAQPLRPALYIAARVDGSVARHEIAARREVRGRLTARPARMLEQPAAPDPLVALDGGQDLCRVSQDIGV